MLDSPLDILYLFYIAITNSAFMQVFTIVVFHFVSVYIKNPRENWYYPKDDDA